MQLQIEEIKSELEDAKEDVARYKIRPYPADYTLQGLYDKWSKEEIYVPEFQRRFVWNLNQASSLIESFLLGLPVPPVFFYREEDTQKLLVIDGQQRLRSIFGFFEEIFPGTNAAFHLRKVKAQWDGSTFSQLSSADRIRLKDSVLRAIIIEQVDPKDNSSIYHIFQRLNTGGTTLTPQEIRNALCHGPFSQLLNDLNLLPNWRALIGTVEPDKRGRDVEMVLRIVALAEGVNEYYKPMKDFLTDFMKKLNKKPDKFEDIKRNFAGAVVLAVNSLGHRPFHIKRGLNVAVCDSVMVAFLKNWSKGIDEMSSKYGRLLDNDSFKDYISSATTDVDTVKKRVELAEQILFP